MNRELRQALERVGWDQLYERHVENLSSPSPRGERAAISPFPDASERSPSFYVNIVEGVWRCFHTDRGGDYVMFRALMEATDFDDEGRAVPDYPAAERRLLVEFGIASPLDPAWIEACRVALFNDPATLANVQRLKPWTQRALYSLSIGYDSQRDRFVLPCYDRAGALVNAKLYRPGGEPKMFWQLPLITGNFLFPHQGWREQILILVEGEPDVVSLRCYGFAAVSGTVGSGAVVPEGPWWHNKDVYIWTDDDAPGREAARSASEQLRQHSQSLRLVRHVDWDGKPNNADVSDYLLHLQRQGHDFQAVQRAIIARLNESTLVEHPHAVFDQLPQHVTFAEALSSQHLNTRLGFTARVSARSEKRYILPTVVNIVCPAQGHQYCRRCPMQTQFHGNAQFTHDPRAPETLKMIRGGEKEQMAAYKAAHGIALQCPDPVALTQEAVDVEHVMLTSSIVEAEGEVTTSIERSRREALVILDPTVRLEENRDYAVQGFVYPDPKTQSGVFVVDNYEPSLVSYERFELTETLRDQLRVFAPAWGETVFEKLSHVGQDLIASTTLIRERLDLHLAYRTVWHSVLQFNFGGARVDRGWIEALVIGDTRCGKSMAFRRLAEHYDCGLLVDCKNQTPAGILGAVITSQSSGERFVVAGILPQQDGRIICFDEFHVSKGFKSSLIDVLSSTRSEGVVRISKAASAQFRARVRAIWLANPGMGRLLSELGCSGVEVIPRVVGQPEDIARFDFAVVVAQEDIDVDHLNEMHQPEHALYPRELHQQLLAWTYSRRADQVVFTTEAVQQTLNLAQQMYQRYDASIPLVEPADQRTRVAKVAVSVAAQCFSTDPTGELIVVLPEHVAATALLFELWYNKPAMGYDRYSDKVRQTRTLRDLDAVQRVFDEMLAPYGRAFAESLLQNDEFTERTFSTFAPANNLSSRSVLQHLYANRCIALIDFGRKDSYRLNAAFVHWLKEYLRTTPED